MAVKTPISHSTERDVSRGADTHTADRSDGRPVKDCEIRARISAEMKAKVTRLVAQRGESESLIVREALVTYLARPDVKSLLNG